MISVPVSQNQQFTASVQNDQKNQGVAWSLTQDGNPCSPACGSLIAFTTQSAVYGASSSPPSPSVVTITATSIADSTQKASAIVQVSLPVAGSPDQWIDITHYGARSVDPAPTATATCTAGSMQVTLSNGGWPQNLTQFENGDSIRLDNCGTPTQLTAPMNVSVSAGMNAGGTPAVSGLSGGNTSYSYQVIACDRAGGCSPASQVVTTNTGFSTLGRVTAPISRMSLSNNLMTVTTVGAHGFAPNALVYIQYFSTQTAQFEGWYIVRTVPNANTFTFLTSIDSRIGGTPILDTSGGTAVAFNCNVLKWDAIPGAWLYFIYGRSSTARPLIGVAEPGTTSWQDYGSPMMDNFSFPSYVPRTPPASASNRYLVTSITDGAGTPSIRIAAPAINSASNVLARMGSDAAILAAYKAATYGTMLIPPGTFQIAGYLDLNQVGGRHAVVQTGALRIAETLQLHGSLYWQGVGSDVTSAFQETATVSIGGLPGSYPTIYFGDGTSGSVQFDHVLLGTTALNGALLLYADSGAAMNFDYVAFGAGQGNMLGYMHRQAIFRTGGFDYNFTKCLFIADQVPSIHMTAIGYTFLPSVLFAPAGSTPTGHIELRDSWFVGKSAIEVNQSNPGSSGGASYNVFQNTQTQNLALPVFIASNYPNSNTWANASASFDGLSPADYPSAITGNWAANQMTVSIQNLSNSPTGSRPLLVGNPTKLLGSDGGTAASGSGGGWFAGGGSQVGYLIPPPSAPPLLTISAGGGVPLGNHTYQTAWTDAFGNSTTVGPSATVNIMSGMQTVTVTPTDPPPGAVGWQLYRDGALTGPSSLVCGPFELGTSQTDTLGFVACSNSAPSQNTAMSAGFGINGEETTQIELTGGGHKTVISGTFSADRMLRVPDVSGTLAVKIASGTVVMPTDPIPAESCGALVNVVAQGVLSTDVVSFSDDPRTQQAANDPKLKHWSSTDSVSFQYCNTTAVAMTPNPFTLNWQVVR